MLGWLTDILDPAVMQALASFAVSSSVLILAVGLALSGLICITLARRIATGRHPFPSKESELARALVAYAAQLPVGTMYRADEVANAQAALGALSVQRKNAGKAQRVLIAGAMHSAAQGNFAPAASFFEEIVTKERARWRPQRPKMAAALRHMATCTRVTAPVSARSAFAQACDLEPADETGLLMLAKLMLEAGDNTQAEPVLDRLVGIADKHSDPLGLVHGLLLRGDCRVRQGMLAVAANDYQRACHVCRGQNQAEKPSPDWRRALALCHARMGEALLQQEKPSEALTHFQTAHGIHNELAGAKSVGIDTLREFAGTCDRIGDIALANGDAQAALESLCEARAIAKRLAEDNPRHPELQREFAVSCNRVGQVLRGLHRLPEALEAFRDDLAISSSLAAAAPTDEGRQRDLAVSYSNLGDMLCALARPSEALVSFEAAKEILEKLHEAAPEDEVREHELALLLARIGAAHAKLNARDEALEAFNAVLTNAMKRAEAMPDDTTRLHDLVQAFTRIGNLHLAAAELESAVSSFDAARQIVERIPEDTHESVSLRRERALCHGRIALARARGDAREDALAAFQAGHTLLAGLNGGSEFLVADDKAWFEGQIAALEISQAFTLQPRAMPSNPVDPPEHEPQRPQ